MSNETSNTRTPEAAADTPASTRFWRTRTILEFIRLAAEILIRTAGETIRTLIR